MDHRPTDPSTPTARGRDAVDGDRPAVTPPAARPADEQPAVDETIAPSRRPVDVPVGGRAALRLERQAAEAARKKGGKRGPDGPPENRGPGRDAAPAEEPARRPRRAVQGLLGVVVIALVVLGVWSFTSPSTNETAAQTPAPSTNSEPAPAPTPAPESVAPPVQVSEAPVGPVRAPITVLNSTNITGLAGSVGDQFAAGGWEVAGTGASPVEDVATTTVYYSEGDTVQQQAAAQLVEQFPDVSGPVARYFEVPDVAQPGLVVVTTGNWQP